jgi:CheY-like chemotaxis protein
MKVLVIEDDDNLRKTMISFIRRTFRDVDGLVVLAALTANEAIALLRESTCEGKAFDLVVSDYDLKDASTGGEVLDWIQAHLSYLESRFVFLSSDSAIARRGVPFFDKPCDLDALRIKMREIVSIA